MIVRHPLFRPGACGQSRYVRPFRSCSRPAATQSRIGLVASFNRPGGNITGVNKALRCELAPKRLRCLLHELVPHATTIGMLINPTRHPNGSSSAGNSGGDKVARGLAVHISRCQQRQRARRSVRRHSQNQVLRRSSMASDPLFIGARKHIVALTIIHKHAGNFFRARFRRRRRPRYVIAASFIGLVSPGWRSMSAASSRVPSPRTCRCCSRPSLS